MSKTSSPTSSRPSKRCELSGDNRPVWLGSTRRGPQPIDQHLNNTLGASEDARPQPPCHPVVTKGRFPFPGMDPYLEAHWRDVHTRVMTYICDQIQDQLPSDLVARVEESVSVDTEDGARLIAPDVSVVEDFEHAAMGVQSESVAVAEPLLVLEEVPQTARHVQILDVSSGERVVTAIEVLSPTNKLTVSGREDYRRKQRDYLNAGVNLVEIDLLRGGQHVLAVAWEFIPEDRRRT